MYLRATKRQKDGKEHRYFTVVESVRVAGQKHPVQKPLLYLGELTDSQQAAWTKTLTVFNTERQTSETLSLFPEDRPPTAGPLPRCWSSGRTINSPVLVNMGLAGWPANSGGSWNWIPFGPAN